MTDPYYWDLANKKLNGNITDEEEAELEKWMNQSAENLKDFEGYKKLWHVTQPDSLANEFSALESWEEIKPELVVHRTPVKKTGFFSSQKLFIKIAASVTLLFAIGYFIFDRVSNEEINWIVAETGNDKTIQVILPDQSKVWLNRNSSLRYPKEFVDNKRSVELVGEAFFDVQRDKEKPFLIQLVSSRIHVLGTSFNVRSYEKDSSVLVSVATGKVNFSTLNNEEIFLEAGEAGSLDLLTLKLVKQENLNTNFRAWQNHILQFKNTKLAEVLKTLENYYDVILKVENPKINSCTFTGTFEQADLEEVIQVLEVSFNIEFQMTGTDYVINGEGCNL